jgi:hypothetical protein
MGPGGLPGLQNRVSGGAPLTGGFDSHAPSPRKWRVYVSNSGNEALARVQPQCLITFLPQFHPKNTGVKNLFQDVTPKSVRDQSPATAGRLAGTPLRATNLFRSSDRAHLGTIETPSTDVIFSLSRRTNVSELDWPKPPTANGCATHRSSTNTYKLQMHIPSFSANVKGWAVA